MNSGGASPFTHETEMPPVRRWKVATSTRTMPEIALLIAEGRSNPEIAERLGISRFTARDHAEQIFVRLKVESSSRRHPQSP